MLLLLALCTGCLLAMTVVLCSTVRDFRSLLRRLNALLPEAGDTLREAKSSLRQVRRLLTRTNHATRHVEAVIQQACSAALAALDRVTFLKGWTHTLFAGRSGNGLRAEPRRQRRHG